MRLYFSCYGSQSTRIDRTITQQENKLAGGLQQARSGGLGVGKRGRCRNRSLTLKQPMAHTDVQYRRDWQFQRAYVFDVPPQRCFREVLKPCPQAIPHRRVNRQLPGNPTFKHLGQCVLLPLNLYDYTGSLCLRLADPFEGCLKQAHI